MNSGSNRWRPTSRTRCGRPRREASTCRWEVRVAEVAVIGAGVAGLTAAHVLQRKHEVTLFEADDRLGGHAHTHDLGFDDTFRRMCEFYLAYSEAGFRVGYLGVQQFGMAGRLGH
ncbi:FAD-dependent oxidoreductase [Lentzea sp. DG1S-22]|uniref:FAD-dependent oxidoreductase n=1 Tax=Lentzea sp. DG1S-22 TaxID=3108822 RepID=UPI003FA5AB2E